MVLRLSENLALRSTGCALVEDYLRLADAWGGDTPAVLPAAHQAIVDGYPGDASPPGGDALIAATADAVLGQVLVVPHAVDVAKIERLYVVESARHRGMGTVLLSNALDLANSLGYRSVVLDVIPERRGAISLYERFGFTPIAPYADYGRPMVFLGRPLSPDP